MTLSQVQLDFGARQRFAFPQQLTSTTRSRGRRRELVISVFDRLALGELGGHFAAASVWV